MSINILSNIITKMGIFGVSFYILNKSINYKVLIKQKIFLLLWSLLWIILYISKLLSNPLLLFNIVYCIITILFSWKILKIKLDTAASAYILSYGLSYFLYFIANMLIGLIFVRFLRTEYNDQSFIDFNNPIYLLIYIFIVSFQFIMARQLFKIKRFKNGFSFLLKKYTVIIILIITGTVVVIASIFSSPREIYDNNYIIYIMFTSGIIIIGAGTIIWIRKSITMFYIKNMKERSIEQLEKELLEKDAEIERLIKQNELLRNADHKTTHRLSALENTVVKIINLIKSSKNLTEIREEFNITLNDIIRLNQDYENDISQIDKEKFLPSTKINGLDNMFRYFSKEYSNNNIEFNLKVNGNIPHLMETIIKQSKLETMIGDFLQNALIAVNANDKTFRSVLAIIGLSGKYYEFTVFDSGIQFEIDTLMVLGKERVTTHADTGGSGIGFMTTFETIKKCGASLIINEKTPNESDYTKSVTVRFDGENRYIIESYRLNDIYENEKYTVNKN